MNSKISLPEMVDLLSRKSDCTKKEAETFLKEFFTLATEILSSGESLKINGLGVFKPVWVGKRNSVNVQTGQPCEIPGHYKLSFTPDKSMRDAVNAPFACFEAEVIADDVDIKDTEISYMAIEDSDMTETNIDDSSTEMETVVMSLDKETSDIVIADIPDEQQNVKKDEIQPEGNQLPNEMNISDKHNQKESKDENTEHKLPAEEYDAQTVPEEKIKEPEEKEHIEVISVSVVDNYEKEEFRRKQTWRNRKNFWYGFVTSLLIFVVADLIWLCYNGTFEEGQVTISSWIPAIIKKQNQEGEKNKDSVSVVKALVMDSLKTTAVVRKDTAMLEDKPITNMNEKSNKVTEKEINNDTMLSEKTVTEIMKPGIFLTTLSLKHFGHKTFWVYIYQENKANITNPNSVPVGTKLIIPEKSKYNIDSNNRESVEKAKALATKILSEYE